MIRGLAFAALVWAVTVSASETLAEERSTQEIQRYGLDLVPYATVRRPDGSYRRMLTAPETLEALAATDRPPEGARILMETYYRPGRVATVFHMQKVAGRWAYGSFPAGTPDLTTRPQASCLSCHGGAAATDLVYTLPSLRAVAAGQSASDFTCDHGGRSPCGAETYLEGAGRRGAGP